MPKLLIRYVVCQTVFKVDGMTYVMAVDDSYLTKTFLDLITEKNKVVQHVKLHFSPGFVMSDFGQFRLWMT